MTMCFLCGRQLLGRAHHHDGQYIAKWNVDVCESCFEVNYQGIALSMHPRLAAHLDQLGVKVELNSAGRADWPIPATKHS
jgi:hypothetical protein